MMSTKKKGIVRRFFDKGTFPHQFSFILDSPFRRFILSPSKLADRLHLQHDWQVLEIGPGSGYFSTEVASRIRQGRLVLFDLQQEMLQKARRRVEAAGWHHVVTIRGDATHLPFGESRFDVVFLVAVLGEVSDAELCLREIHKILSPSGLLSITEQPGDPDFLSLPLVRSLAEKQGFELVESFGKKKNFTANFKKVEEP